MRKNKKNIIFGSVLVVVIFVSALSINAVESNEQTYSETIFFLGNKNIAPIIFEEDGEAEGIAVDLVKALEEKINFNIDVQALDWVEAQNKVLTGVFCNSEVHSFATKSTQCCHPIFSI